jgi:putative iron-dependent peroxidase
MSVPPFQPAIISPVPPFARFVSFRLREGGHAESALKRLSARVHDPQTVVGFGVPLLDSLEINVEGLRSFPEDMAQFPSTQAGLWLALSHTDPSARFDAGRSFAAVAGDAFTVGEEIARLALGRQDLSGSKTAPRIRGDASARGGDHHG